MSSNFLWLFYVQVLITFDNQRVAERSTRLADMPKLDLQVDLQKYPWDNVSFRMMPQKDTFGFCFEHFSRSHLLLHILTFWGSYYNTTSLFNIYKVRTRVNGGSIERETCEICRMHSNHPLWQILTAWFDTSLTGDSHI